MKIEQNLPHAVVIVPGLQDDIIKTAWIASLIGNLRGEADFSTQSIGWLQHTTRQEMKECFDRFFKPSLTEIIQKYQSLSLLGISAGAVPALLYALEYPSKIHSVVSFCGGIQYDQKFHHGTGHQGFAYLASRLDQTLKRKFWATSKLMPKTLAVTASKDGIVPTRLQVLPGARTVSLDKGHLAATTIGLLLQMIQNKSLVYNWLLHGSDVVASLDKILPDKSEHSPLHDKIPE